jgi:hypothetical protein
VAGLKLHFLALEAPQMAGFRCVYGRLGRHHSHDV